MNTPKYYLQAPRKFDGKSNVYLKFTYKISRNDSIRIAYPSTVYIHPNHWDKKKQRVKTSFAFPEHEQFNTELDRLEHLVKEIYREYRTEKKTLELTKDRFKLEIDNKFWGVSNANKKEFLPFLEEHLANYKADPDYNNATNQIYNRTRDLLNEFTEFYGKFDFDQVNVLLIRKFVAWLRTYEFKTEMVGYSDNTIIKIISRFKAFLEGAVKLGYTNNKSFREATNKALGLRKTPGDKIYLSISELKHFYSFQYSSDRLRRVVDIFTAASMLGGLRVSDWNDIKASNFYEKNGISLFESATRKTSQLIVVPVHPIVKKILTRYNGSLKKISDQKMNNYLKEAAKEAGFTQIRIKRTRKKHFIEEQKPMYKFFSCHVARNNFNSNALEALVPGRDVKKFMGHANKDITETYDRRSLERIALSYADHPFFNNW